LARGVYSMRTVGFHGIHPRDDRIRRPKHSKQIQWGKARRIGGGGGGPMYRCGMHLGRNRGLGLLGHPEDVKKALFTVISNQGRRIQLDGGRAGGSREKPLDDRSDVNKANSRIKDKKPSEGENDENKSTAADPRVCTSTHGKSLPSVPLQYGTRGVRMGGGGASDLAQRAYRWGEPRGQGPRRMRRWVVERRG
jgi:hypothetical protein